MNTPIDLLLEDLKKDKQRVASTPFVVSVMGETGVGKTSLINKLFNTKFDTHDFRAATLEPTKHETRIKDKDFIFWDLPGLGESPKVDLKYFPDYIDKAYESDVIIWAVNAESRSISLGILYLTKLLSKLRSNEDKIKIFNKITFIMTKVDLLYQPSWIYVKSKDTGYFRPDNSVIKNLNDKVNLFKQDFIGYFAKYIATVTFNDCNFDVSDKYFKVSEYRIECKKILHESDLVTLSQKYPKYVDVFKRIVNNQSVIPCSTIFSYNLNRVLSSITDKLSNESSIRSEGILSLSNKDLSIIPVSKVSKLINLYIYDNEKQEFLLDLTKIDK